jgi:chromosome segregation ATPase
MAKKNTAVAPVVLTPAQELEALKVQREEIEAQIKGYSEAYKAAQVVKKDLQEKIKAIYGSIVESRKSEKIEKLEAAIAKLHAQREVLAGGTTE